MIVDLKEYDIAAILWDINQRDHSGFLRVFDVDQFKDEFQRVYGVAMPEPLLAAAVHKIVEKEGGKIITDPFTRDYIRLDARACIHMVVAAEDEPETVLGKTVFIGKKYIEEALIRIVELGEANLLAEYYDFEEPDRFTDIDHGSPLAKKIDDEFETLIRQLNENNESAVALGDSLDVARSEVADLYARWNNVKLRAASFVNQAQQTLIWIGREAGKSVVGHTAKRLFDLIVEFFF